MKQKISLLPLVMLCFSVFIFVMTSQIAFSEMTLNDNVNIEGDVFLEGNDCGINFSDGSRQTTGAIPPWSQKITDGRFVLVLGEEAVLDRETGLVWQRNTNGTTYQWVFASEYCYKLELGGRKGWRLPTIDELATLVDTSNSPAYPSGVPFTNVDSEFYWSSTPYLETTDLMWGIGFYDGTLYGGLKTIGGHVRAVRSGQ